MKRVFALLIVLTMLVSAPSAVFAEPAEETGTDGIAVGETISEGNESAADDSGKAALDADINTEESAGEENEIAPESEEGVVQETSGSEVIEEEPAEAQPEGAESAEKDQKNAEAEKEDPEEQVLLEEAAISGDWEYSLSGNNAVITHYRGTNKDITIPSSLDGHSVTIIGDNAFNERSELTSVVIPNTVTKIQEYAFYGCSGLKKITWSSALQTIEMYAFTGCKGLTEINLPASLKTIDYNVFADCENVVKLTIPKNVRWIHEGAFDDCVKLKNIYFNAVNCDVDIDSFCNAGASSSSLTLTIGNGVKEVPACLCSCAENRYMKVTEVVFPNSVETIREYAFENCKKLTKIKWGVYLDYIGSQAFMGCSALKTITFPKNLKSIDNEAFANCSALSNVSFPEGLEDVYGAFDGCTSLGNVFVYGKNTSVDADEFRDGKDVTVYCYMDSLVEYMAKIKKYNIVYLDRSSYFTDVPPTHNYQKAVYWAADNKIAAGYNNGLFGVADNITRGQVVMFLWRAAGKPVPKKSTQTFSDVPVKHGFYSAIQWASEQKITAGYKDGRFGVDDNCTRGQIMTFLWRYKGKPAPSTTGQSFTDVPTTHAYYGPIQWASENNVTAGYKDGRFGVKDQCTRGQCVTFLYRMDKL